MINREPKKRRLNLAWLVAIVLSMVFLASAFGQDDPLLPDPNLAEEPHMPGRVEGTGTYFEVNDSNYLNITFESSEPVHLVLESVPEMVVMEIEAANDANWSEITLGGFEPNTTYYKYEDNYHNEVALTTDPNGSYAYVQDLNERHIVFIQPSAGTIFLSDEGWKDSTGADPGVGTWDSSTKTGMLTTDVYETIQIDSNGITLDGNGYTITGSNAGFGVYLTGRTGASVKNLSVQRFHHGIYLRTCSDSTLAGNTANWNHDRGIQLYFSGGNILTGNSTSNNNHGIYLRESSGNSLAGNTANSNDTDGIRLFYSNGNILTGNTANSNNYHGIFLWNASGNILTGNTANSNNYQIGIWFWQSSNNTLTGNTASDNFWGIRLSYNCSGNTLTGNTASNNYYGIDLENSSGNILTGNTANSNNYYGIFLLNTTGNVLTCNTVSGNKYGIYVGYCNGNQIYNNNFIDNVTQAFVSESTGNLFNLEAPIGGNYWSDWCPPSQPDTDGDGFVDFPYVFTGGQDNLPWVSQDGWLAVAPTWPDGSTLTASDVGLMSLTLTWTPAVHDVGVARIPALRGRHADRHYTRHCHLL